MRQVRRQVTSNALKRRSKKITPEWRLNMSLAHLGKKRGPLTQEHKRKLAESNKRTWSSKELRRTLVVV